MDALSTTYIKLSSRARAWEFAVHAALLTYSVLLCVAVLLNTFSPEWVSRNSSSVKGSQILDSSSLPIKSSGENFEALSRCVTRGLLLDKNEDPVVKRVQAETNCGCSLPQVDEPEDVPNVCAVVQSGDNYQNIEKIGHALVTNPAIDEIVICESGSSEQGLERWTEQLRGVKHFIIVSNNQHESYCYNRAMRLSSADFFILMQDDSLPPVVKENHDNIESTMTTDNWVPQALMLFEADEKLGILSGFIGELGDETSPSAYEFGEQSNDLGDFHLKKTLRIPFLSPRTLYPFMYCECAWPSPLFIRAQSLRRLGGLDIALDRNHETGVWPHCVLSYAAWTAGYRVGVYNSEFLRGNGSVRYQSQTYLQNAVRDRASAKTLLYSRYDRKFIHSYVVMINHQTLVLRYKGI